MNEVVISNQMAHLGLDPSLLGFRYMVDLVKMIDEAGDPAAVQVTKAYHDIAKRFGSTWMRVERNIRTVINHYYDTHSTYHTLLEPDAVHGTLHAASFIARLWYILRQDRGYFPDGSCWAIHRISTEFGKYEVRVYIAGGNYTAFTGTREGCNKYIHKGMNEHVV